MLSTRPGEAACACGGSSLSVAVPAEKWILHRFQSVPTYRTVVLHRVNTKRKDVRNPEYRNVSVKVK